jgi:hypothetical protein
MPDFAIGIPSEDSASNADFWIPAFAGMTLSRQAVGN